jgi:trehalose 6-phosphate synthase/phosphatase
MASPLVIVSNRLPISVKRSDGGLELYPSVGGLATGLATYVSDRRNKWIGWPGIASDSLTEKERQFIAVELRKQNCYPVFLKQKQLDDFYNGYSNTILWPLFHDLPARMEDHDKYWKAYKAVNSAFAGVVLALSDAKSAIWVHDYQLLLLPALLRVVLP